MLLALGTCFAFFAAAAASATTAEMSLVAYLGGAGTDDCDGITLDRAGDIYLACHSDSPDFPHLPAKAAPQSRDMDAVVLKIEARTGRIVRATRMRYNANSGDRAEMWFYYRWILRATRSFPGSPSRAISRAQGPRSNRGCAAPLMRS
jgi:hypothetical protein